MINEGKRMRKCAIIKRVSETRLISLWELEARPREEETPSREHISSRRIKRGKKQTNGRSQNSHSSWPPLIRRPSSPSPFLLFAQWQRPNGLYYSTKEKIIFRISVRLLLNRGILGNISSGENNNKKKRNLFVRHSFNASFHLNFIFYPVYLFF